MSIFIKLFGDMNVKATMYYYELYSNISLDESYRVLGPALLAGSGLPSSYTHC